VAVGNGDVDVEPLAREDAQYATASDRKISRLVATSDSQAPGQLSHLQAIVGASSRRPERRFPDQS
jgi:hypothetical protein